MRTTTVRCDGIQPGQPEGHPAVYLPLEEGETVTCPYCGRAFSETSA